MEIQKEQPQTAESAPAHAGPAAAILESFESLATLCSKIDSSTSRDESGTQEEESLLQTKPLFSQRKSDA